MNGLKSIERASLFGLMAGSAVMMTACSSQASQTKHRAPNIVMITVDDLGWTDAHCYGSEYYETPNVDRLASQGMRFTNYYAACALCSPTRASMMTGRYPARVGITDWIRAGFQPGGEIPPDGQNPSGYEKAEGKDWPYLTPKNPLWMELDEVTIAEVLKKAGYTTCHIGKWHLGPKGYYPTDQGFDYNIGGCDYGEPPSYFDPYHRAPMPEYDYDTIPNIPTLPNRKTGEYLTDRESWEAVNFIKNHKDEPFFLNLCHYAVHVPLQAKDSLVQKYREKPKTNQKNPVYAAMVENVDISLGKVMAALDSLGLTDNTILIYTSDNGGLAKDGTTSNLPLRSGKAFPYEGGIRIPLIVRWPGHVEPASVSHEQLSSIDIFPTLCDVANTAVPDSLTIDGKDFVPVLTGQGEFKPHEALIWHYPHYRIWDNTIPYSIILKGDWKLIRWYGDKPLELYNLKEDIGEKNNLAGKRPEKAKELEDELMQRLVAMNAKLPKKNPDYKPKN